LSSADLPSHNKRIQSYYDAMASKRDEWIRRNIYFHEEDWKYLRFIVPKYASVLEVGCGTGQLLGALNPAVGVGIDISPAMIEKARENHPNFDFRVGDAADPAVYDSLNTQFDYVVISDSIGMFYDCMAVFEAIQKVCSPSTRLVVSYYNYHWEPILKLGRALGMQMPQPESNYFSTADLIGFLHLSDFEAVSAEWRLLFPMKFFGLGPFLNLFIGTLPLIRRACLRNYVIARSTRHLKSPNLSCTVVIPCRNEKGNIESAIRRLPRFCDDIEVIFVEGHSSDGTLEECERVRDEYSDWNIKVLRQPGKGKADAVTTGFAAAEGDVLMILDADLTVPPEDLPKFYQAITDGKGEFITGTRLVYPMEDQAMRFLNLIANWTFARIFSYLLNQRFTDTLCGTKVLRKSHYLKIVENRDYFGDFDPFGDFDLIFGAAKLGLKSVDIPVRYANRNYGTTQISRFRHGWQLLKMVVFAFRKLKAL